MYDGEEPEFEYYCLNCGEGFDYPPRNDSVFCEECYCPECDELFENCMCDWED